MDGANAETHGPCHFSDTDPLAKLATRDAASGALLLTFQGHSREVRSAAFSPDGTRVLSGSSDRTVKLWDAATGALLRTFEGHPEEVSSVAFSPDGTRVLSGGGNAYLRGRGDDKIRLWDAATGVLLRNFHGYSEWVYSVAFSPDGARVLSGGDDGTVILWDAATGAPLRVLQGDAVPVYSVAFSPDGARVLSGHRNAWGKSNWDNMVRLWDATTARARCCVSSRGIPARLIRLRDRRTAPAAPPTASSSALRNTTSPCRAVSRTPSTGSRVCQNNPSRGSRWPSNPLPRVRSAVVASSMICGA
jgi:WD40 repeat protein